MKTAHDPRHQKRQIVVQQLFGSDFHKQRVNAQTEQVLKQREMLDKTIQEAAPDFPVDKINKIDLAILRLAAFELLIDKKEPQNVVIDEAVELAKEFGNDTSPAFINGVLGHILSYAKST